MSWRHDQVFPYKQLQLIPVGFQAWLYALDGGWVFHAGPSKQMNYFGTIGAGKTVPAGLRAQAPGGPYTQQYGSSIMFSATDTQMKIMTIGGTWTEYPPADVDAYPVAFLVTLTLGDVMPPAQPAVKRLPDMTYGRAFCTSTVLPDGKVLVTGGQKHVEVFTDNTAVLAPELYDPVTNTWSVLRPACCARTYHSICLLLPDATVLTGGGGLCSVGDNTCATLGSSHFDVHIFVPPNLLKADGVTRREQPIIAAAPTSVVLGTTITITMNVTSSNQPPTIASFCLIRSGATTHTVNNDLRRIPLTFTKLAGLKYNLQLPKKKGTAPPGFYMLFAVDSAGVPSKAPFVQVK